MSPTGVPLVTLIDLVTHNLYMHVTTNVVSAIPSINEYCMNVNVWTLWTQGAANLTLNVAKWVSLSVFKKETLRPTSINVCINVCMNVIGIKK